MAQATYTLERALAAPLPGREGQWRERAGAALAVVVDLIRQHVESAEEEGGLVSELELAVGHNRDVRLAMSDHRDILSESESLLADLSAGPDEPATPATDLRERTAALMDLLRRHRWREVDLILGVFGLDVGSGD